MTTSRLLPAFIQRFFRNIKTYGWPYVCVMCFLVLVKGLYMLLVLLAGAAMIALGTCFIGGTPHF